MAVSLIGRRVVSPRHNLFISQYRTGYIVLLPEVAQTQNVPENTLPQTDGLLEVSTLTTEKCVAAIGKHTLDFESSVWRIEEKLKESENPPKDLFVDVLNPLEKLGAPLDATWGLMKTLYLANTSVMPGNCYMSIHERARRVRMQKFNSKPIYMACKDVDSTNLTEEQRRVVGKFVLEGRLNGLDLGENAQTKLRNTLNKIGQERTKFRSKVEIATKKFKHVVMDPNIVREFPEDLLKSMAYDSSQFSRGPWTVTLQPHISSPFLEYCPDRNMRWNVWQATVRRSSGYEDQAIETSTHLEELRSLRQQQAKLLGFKNFANMSMQTKMAGSIENVQSMLERLAAKAQPAQEQEVKTLEEFAVSRGFEGTLQIWDVPYWKRKQQKSLFSFDEEHLREYFPLTQVLMGLFALCEELFGLQIVEQPGVNAWHQDVQFFHIIESDSTKPVAGFYFDPYAREDEKLRVQEDSGWMVALRNKSSISSHHPLAALVFNFQPPLYGKPSLLTFREVRLLFQKFGHALQHLLTKTTYTEVSGLSNVEWDAVEIGSHFMTHWLYNIDTVKNLSCHYETSEPLPAETLERLGQVRHHMTGYDLSRELYLAALDLELHTSNDFWLDVVRRLWPKYSVFPLDKRDSHPCSFTAIFSEEWGAAYYCHLWSRLVAADVFSAFLEAGLENSSELRIIGNRFRSTFLALGGACHPAEVFRRFRGRDPSPTALLLSMGLKQLAPVHKTN